MAGINAVEAIAILETQLPPGTLNAVKRTVFQRSWEGVSYGAIAEESGYDADYIRESGALLWRSISDLLDQKVTKRNFRALLLQRLTPQGFMAQQTTPSSLEASSPETSSPEDITPGRRASTQHFTQADRAHNAGSELEANQQALTQSSNSTRPQNQTPPPLQSLSIEAGGHWQSLTHWQRFSTQTASSQCDWGEAPDVSTFYGRQSVLANIQSALQENCRLLVLAGIGGIGKTALAAKAAQQFQHSFRYVMWRSLRNAPPLKPLLNQLLAFFSEQQVVEGNLSNLLTQLRQNRCLLILDNAETLMESGQIGTYRSGFEDYGHFFRTWGETAHQSCLLLTTREKPPEIASLEGEHLPVRVMVLQGEKDMARALLQDKEIQGNDAELENLCSLYAHNPLALKLAATSIHTLFEGQIVDFLAEGALALDGLRRLLDEQLQRLSTLEHQVILWLAINRTWTPLGDLHRDLVPQVSRLQILRTLESLAARSLIQVRGSRYSLQPVVMEYVLERLVNQLFRELAQSELIHWLTTDCTAFDFEAPLPHLHTHALVKTQALEYIREIQKNSILEPLGQRLRQIMRSPQKLREHVQSLMDYLRGSGVAASGYACANLLDLALYLQLDLSNLDGSSLTYRQADLRHAQLHQVNFTQAEFIDCAFTQVFGSLLSLEYSPDGTQVVTGDSRGNIHVWQAPCKVLLESFTAHRGRIHSLAFSPDGQLLASGGDDGQVQLWNVDTWTCSATLEAHERFIWSLAWNADGTLLASGGGDRTVHLWDVETNTSLHSLKFPSSWIQAVAFSPDGALLATGSDDCAVRLWDIPSGQYLGCLLGHERWVCTVAFSPDGHQLATGGHDRTIRLWNVESGDCLAVLQGHRGLVRSLAFSADGQFMISTSSDQTLRLWDMKTQTCMKTLTGHVGWVQDAAFSPDGTLLVSGGHDQTLRSWNRQTGTTIEIQRGYARGVRTVDWRQDGRALVTCGNDHRVRIWDLAQGQMHPLSDEDTSGFWISLWSPDGTMLATGSKDHSIQLWEAKTGRLLRKLMGHRCWVGALRFCPKGERLVSGSADATLRLWDTKTGRLLHCLTGHSGRICSVDFGPEGQLLASGSIDHSIRLWNSLTGEYLGPLQGHEDLVTVVRIQPTGHYLASGSLDRSIRIWDLTTGQCLITLAQQASSITCLSWKTHDYNKGCGSGHGLGHGEAPPLQLVTGSTDGQIRRWDIQALLSSIPPINLPPHESTTQTGRTLSPEHWGPHSHSIGHHNQAVWDIACAPTDHQVASTSDDGTTRIWHMETGDCIAQLTAEGPYNQMNITKARGLTTAQLQSLHTLGAFTSAGYSEETG